MSDTDGRQSVLSVLKTELKKDVDERARDLKATEHATFFDPLFDRRLAR
jgi:hypothetical protein